MSVQREEREAIAGDMVMYGKLGLIKGKWSDKASYAERNIHIRSKVNELFLI